MAQAVFGSIAAFGLDSEDITEWMERLEQWFEANAVTDAGRQRAILLSNIGSKGYKLVRSLSQNAPTSKSYKELKDLLLEHLDPNPNEISQRFVFYRRDRRSRENVKNYIAELRRLSEHCNFQTKLEEHLRDKFVCGLNDGAVQQKLLATKGLTLKIAIDTSVAMEAAARSAKQIHGVGLEGQAQVHRLGRGGGIRSPQNRNVNNRAKKECYRCGGLRHLADKCPFKEKECFGCKQLGHSKRKCRNSGENRSGAMTVHRVDDADAEYEEEEVEGWVGDVEEGLHFLNLYRLGDDEGESIEPLIIVITINKIKVDMEVDTGAAITVMCIELYQRLNGGPLEPSNLRLKTYTGEILRPLGIGWVEVIHNGRKLMLPITVLSGSVPTLMGRNWLRLLELDWKALFTSCKKSKNNPGIGPSPSSQIVARKAREVNLLEEKVIKRQVKAIENPKEEIVVMYKSKDKEIEKLVEEMKLTHPEILRKCLKVWEVMKNTQRAVSVNDMKDIFPGVFRSKLGCLKGVKINIPVSSDVKPKFFKARPVPYALRNRVDEELEKLEGQGVWKKVKYSKWAAPIVVVLKDGKNPSGPIRICGDYKITVNTAAPCDTYPIPNTNEQLATLAGGDRFSKIDLSQAYQQLELDETSKELLTVNTHRGLYQPDRLQFGVHSATGIFQREMEQILSGIPHVLARIDDILMTGKDDWSHFVVLVRVLVTIEESGLTVNLKKCMFFQESIIFCGYTISREGVRPMQGNVDAVLEAPEPKNVSEVKSFLGMLNYYQNYLPSLATITHRHNRVMLTHLSASRARYQKPNT